MNENESPAVLKSPRLCWATKSMCFDYTFPTPLPVWYSRTAAPRYKHTHTREHTHTRTRTHLHTHLQFLSVCAAHVNNGTGTTRLPALTTLGAATRSPGERGIEWRRKLPLAGAWHADTGTRSQSKPAHAMLSHTHTHTHKHGFVRRGRQNELSAVPRAGAIARSHR